MSKKTRRIVLAVILLVGFFLRSYNLDWDRGTHLQPDERFWSDVAAHIHAPEKWDLKSLTDPEVSTLSPRVYKPNYVYGIMPLWATKATAWMALKPAAAPFVAALDSFGVNLLNDAGPEVPIEARLRFNTGYDSTIIGRLLSAIVDTFSILMVYLLAKELSNRRAGLLAAALQAATVLHIQYSHFLGSEPWVALFVAAVTYYSVRIARGDRSYRTVLLCAASLGLAVGTKLSGIAVVAAPAAAALALVMPVLFSNGYSKARKLVQPASRWERVAETKDQTGLLANKPATRSQSGPLLLRLFSVIEPFILIALASVLIYRIVQPYDFEAGISLKYNERFFADWEYLRGVNSGGNWPWVLPLVGTKPLWHPLKQMVLWGMGPALGLAGFAGIALAMFKVRARQLYWLVPLAVVAGYFALVATQFYAIIRYLQPVYPVLTALAGCFLVAVWDNAKSLRTSQSQVAAVFARLSQFVVVAVLVITVFWAFAFVNGVYGRDNARMAAGDWMIQNLEPGSTVSFQEWDDPLPFNTAHPFQHVTFRPFSFGGDTPEGIRELVRALDSVDYVVESSNRFYDSLPKTPARYPQITQYYDSLFAGELGFELIAEFNNPPSLFGIEIDDSSAEEAFSVYDHPTVHIWKKTPAFSAQLAQQVLNPEAASLAINIDPNQSYANAAMLRPDDYELHQNNNSFSEVHSFKSRGLLAAVLWLVLFEVFAFAAFGLVASLARGFTSIAFGYSKVVGLLLMALPIWFLNGYLGVQLNRSSITISAILGFVLAAAVCWSVRHRIKTAFIQHRNHLLVAQAVYLCVFFAVLVLRFTNPDVWHEWNGGEKPMELAYFTAVSGSSTLPPYDPWFAKGALNYYYFGWFLLSIPTRIIGLLPDVAFNLSVATTAALAAVTVFATAGFAIELATRRARNITTKTLNTPDPTHQRAVVKATSFASPSLKGGVLGVVMFLVMGNLDVVRQVFERIKTGQPLSEFDWWGPSRVLKDSPGYEVTEFPSFTVIFADLHPHFMAMAYFGLVLGLCLAHIERARTNAEGASLAIAAALGLSTGIVRIVHTWDMPTSMLAALGSILIATIIAKATWGRKLFKLGSQLVVFALFHYLLITPFVANNHKADTGFHRSQTNSDFVDTLFHFGVFFLIAALYLLWRGGAFFAEHRRATTMRRLADINNETQQLEQNQKPETLETYGVGHANQPHSAVPDSANRPLEQSRASQLSLLTRLSGVSKPLWAAITMIAAGVLILGLNSTGILLKQDGSAPDPTVIQQNLPNAGVGTVALLALAMMCGFVLLSYTELKQSVVSSAHIFIACCWTLGFAVLFGVELFTLNADIQRLNTVFKFWLAVWHLFALGSAFAVVLMKVEAPSSLVTATDNAKNKLADKLNTKGLLMVFRKAALVLVAVSLLYPALTIKPRQARRIDNTLSPSLNGTMWLEQNDREFGVRDYAGADHRIKPGADRLIIDWLRENTEGRPTILEAVGGAEYQWWARIAIHTGLPTPLGWRWHQEQQRQAFGHKVNERKAQIGQFFLTENPDEIANVLRIYDVSYVIVGSIEAAVSNPNTLALFKTLPYLEAVYEQDEYRIYEVEKDELAQSREPIVSIGSR